MARETLIDSRQEILRTAARLFQQRGYDATSMNDVAAALKLSKGGLYHHFQSKDEILFEIMNHAMEITEGRVLAPVRGILVNQALRLLCAGVAIDDNLGGGVLALQAPNGGASVLIGARSAAEVTDAITLRRADIPAALWDALAVTGEQGRP